MENDGTDCSADEAEESECCELDEKLDFERI